MATHTDGEQCGAGQSAGGIVEYDQHHQEIWAGRACQYENGIEVHPAAANSIFKTSIFNMYLQAACSQFSSPVVLVVAAVVGGRLYGGEPQPERRRAAFLLCADRLFYRACHGHHRRQ
jgi:hypothetical protein